MALKSVLVKTNEKPNNRLECPICKERFWLRCKYDDHVTSHHQLRLSCNICSKGFYDQKLLDEHYLTHTEVIKTYDCNECSRKFLQKYQLEQHMQFHKPVDLKNCRVNKKKSAYTKNIGYLKNQTDDFTDSEEFTEDEDEFIQDEEKDDFSDFEDYIPANKILQTRSGRMVKRKKLFDEDETEVKQKISKTEQVLFHEKETEIKQKISKTERRTPIDKKADSKQKISTTERALFDKKDTKVKQKIHKTKRVSFNEKKPKVKCKTSRTEQILFQKSSIIPHKKQKDDTLKASDMDTLQKKIANKKLTVVVEKISDHMYAKYMKKKVSLENQRNSDSIFVKNVSPIVTSNAENYPHKGRSKQPNLKNVQELSESIIPSCTQKSDSSTNSVATKKSATAVSSKFSNKNIIVTNTVSCPNPVQHCKPSENFKVPIGRVKPLFKERKNSEISVSPCKTGKQYMYVGPDRNPDFRKILKVIEEVNTMSNQEISVSNDISNKKIEPTTQNINALNSPKFNAIDKNLMPSTNNTHPTSFNATPVQCYNLTSKDGAINSMKSTSYQNVNQLKESLPYEEGILGQKVVGPFTLVKVTPEYMEKIQKNPLEHPIVSSQKIFQSCNKKVNAPVSHLVCNLNKSSAPPAKKQEITENEISNSAAEIAPVSHLASNLNKSLTPPAKTQETTEKQISNSAASTSVEANTLNAMETSQSSVECSIVNSSNSVEHSKVSMQSPQSLNKQTVAEVITPNAASMVSNVNKNVTFAAGKQEVIGNQRSNPIVNTLFDSNQINMQTYQKNFAQANVDASATLVHSNIPVQFQNISVVHTTKPMLKSHAASLVHSNRPNIHSPTVYLINTNPPTIQSPVVSFVHSKASNTHKILPNKKLTKIAPVSTPPVCSKLNKNLTFRPGMQQQITKESQKFVAVAYTPFQLNKNDNLKVYGKKPDEELITRNEENDCVQLPSQNNLNELHNKNVLNCTIESDKEHRRQLNDIMKLHESMNIAKDLACQENANQNNQILFQTNGNLTLNKNEMIIETQKSVVENFSFEANNNDSIEGCQSNSIEKMSITYEKKDEKNIETQGNLNEPQNNIAETFDFETETESEETEHEKNNVDDDYLHEDESQDIEIISSTYPEDNDKTSSRNNRNLTDTTKSFVIEACQQKTVDDHLIQNEKVKNVRKLPQSNLDDLFAAVSIAKKSLDCGTESAEQCIDNLSGSLESFKNQDSMMERALSTESEKEHISEKNTDESGSKVVKMKKIKQNRIQSSGKKRYEKLLQLYNAKLEEKERKKKEKYEFKKRMNYIEKVLSSPSKDSDKEHFSKVTIPFPRISINDMMAVSEKCVTEAKEKTDELACKLKSHFESSKQGNKSNASLPASKKSNKKDMLSEVSPVTEDIFMTRCRSDSNDFTDSIFSNEAQDKDTPNHLKNIPHSEHFEEAIEKARSISFKFNKDLSENEYLKLLEQLDELLVTYDIADKCQFLNKIIRFCRLFVDSYKVRQKAISLGTKLKM